MAPSIRYLEMRHVEFVMEREGTGPIRDAGLVESALFRPSTTVMGADAYPSIGEKAAALLHSLCLNHPLVDGNKRLAAASALILLQINGHRASLTNDELFALTMGVASGTMRDVPTIATRLNVVPRASAP